MQRFLAPGLGWPRVCCDGELISGGPGGNNLEPESFNEILDELEDWGAILRADADMARALEAIEAARVEDQPALDELEDLEGTVGHDAQEPSP